MRRPTWAELLLAAAVLGPSPAAAAQDAGVRVALTCRPEAAPGRVLCELKYVANTGLRLAWVDALVKSSPQFARPLRSRVTPERFKEAGPSERKLSLAFVASAGGVGTVTVQARAVVCSGHAERERCWPERHEVETELRVGAQ